MHNVIVAGIGTDIGKTVVSAILVEALQADYWKPVQCAGNDSKTVAQLVNLKGKIHPESYCFEHPVSPHQAARMQGIEIDPEHIVLPKTENTLVIELCGGLLVPITAQKLLVECLIEKVKKDKSKWILVSKHYLGSINHTLLSHAYLKAQNLPVMGIIFNGAAHPDSEQAILSQTGLKFLGRLEPEAQIDSKLIQRYAKLWKPALNLS